MSFPAGDFAYLEYGMTGCRLSEITAPSGPCRSPIPGPRPADRPGRDRPGRAKPSGFRLAMSPAGCLMGPPMGPRRPRQCPFRHRFPAFPGVNRRRLSNPLGCTANCGAFRNRYYLSATTLLPFGYYATTVCYQKTLLPVVREKAISAKPSKLYPGFPLDPHASGKDSWGVEVVRIVG